MKPNLPRPHIVRILRLSQLKPVNTVYALCDTTGGQPPAECRAPTKAGEQRRRQLVRRARARRIKLAILMMAKKHLSRKK
jgi:hypothetical protein